MEIQYKTTLPTKEQFYRLYKTTGWNERYQFTEDDLYKAISHSWYLVSVYGDGELIGFGRMISDGIYQTFIGDLIVHPDYQSRGIGSKVLTMLVEKCKDSGMKWVQLTCAKGKADFYKKYGFEERPADAPGMQKFL